jgi:molybdopterin synthase catalytic subunit
MRREDHLFLGTAPIPPSQGMVLEDAACGGVCSFLGRVREEHLGRKVLHLHYEAYESLAWRELRALTALARQRWNLGPILLAHRTGRLEIGDAAVLIGVAAGHRDEAFEACRFLIEGVKRQVPIWKHEFYADGGEAWVGAPGWKGAAAFKEAL